MITCIGIGPGDPGYLTNHAVQLLSAAEVIAGFESVLNNVCSLSNPAAEIVPLTYKNQSEKLAEVAKSHQQGKHCVIAFMGDIHFSGFQLLERVEAACGHAVLTVPGISSAQILASRGRVCFDETTFLTFHRRGDLEPFKRHLLHVLADERNAIVIPRPWDLMPKEIAEYLLSHGVSPEHQVEIWEELTVKDARWSGRLDECIEQFSDMSIMLIRTLQPMPSQVK